MVCVAERAHPEHRRTRRSQGESPRDTGTLPFLQNGVADNANLRFYFGGNGGRRTSTHGGVSDFIPLGVLWWFSKLTPTRRCSGWWGKSGSRGHPITRTRRSTIPRSVDPDAPRGPHDLPRHRMGGRLVPISTALPTFGTNSRFRITTSQIDWELTLMLIRLDWPSQRLDRHRGDIVTRDWRYVRFSAAVFGRGDPRGASEGSTQSPLINYILDGIREVEDWVGAGLPLIDLLGPSADRSAGTQSGLFCDPAI